jgi:hypothetical protein
VLSQQRRKPSVPRDAIGVQKHDRVALTLGGATIPSSRGVATASPEGRNHPCAGPGGHSSRPVGGPVVHNDDLEPGSLQLLPHDGANEVADERGLIARRNHH